MPCHMDRPKVKGLGGSGAGILFDGGAEEWGGRGGKENTGEEMVLLCQGMPLMEIKGYCFYTHEHFWTQGLKDDAAARVMNNLASLLFS